MIESRYNTDFTIFNRSELKVDGRIVTTFVEDITTTYKCAIFTSTTQRTVSFGKRQFVIEKNLYCSTTTPLALGDYVTVDGNEYDVIFLQNTNNLNHHYTVGLVTRNT